MRFHIHYLSALNIVAFLEKSSGCDKGWIKFQDNCYYLARSSLSWKDAMMACRSQGSWLATTETLVEHEWMRMQMTIAGLANNVWIGGTDVVNEGTWRWEYSGKRIDINGWFVGEPEGKSRENCLMLNKPYQYNWVDCACDAKAYYLCEKPASKKSTLRK